MSGVLWTRNIVGATPLHRCARCTLFIIWHMRYVFNRLMVDINRDKNRYAWHMCSHICGLRGDITAGCPTSTVASRRTDWTAVVFIRFIQCISSTGGLHLPTIGYIMCFVIARINNQLFADTYRRRRRRRPHTCCPHMCMRSQSPIEAREPINI